MPRSTFVSRLAIDCANRWFGIVVLFGGALIICYVAAAVWLVRMRASGRVAT